MPTRATSGDGPQYPRSTVSAPDLPAQRRPSSRRRTTRTDADAPARRAPRSRIVPPILVRQVRNGIEESVHRGDIVEVDVEGRLIRGLGDPDRLVTLAELRQAVRRRRADRGRRDRGVRPRAGRDRDHGQLPLRRGPPRPDDPGDVPASRRVAVADRDRASRACRSTSSPRCGSPATASSPARSGTCAPASTRSRSCCPDSRAGTPTDYWREDHPSQAAYREVVARAFGDDAGQAPHRDRRLRRPDLRVPASRGRQGLRDAGRPVGAAVERFAVLPRRGADASSATRCSPIRRWSAARATDWTRR